MCHDHIVNLLAVVNGQAIFLDSAYCANERQDALGQALLVQEKLTKNRKSHGGRLCHPEYDEICVPSAFALYLRPESAGTQKPSGACQRVGT